MPRFLLHHLIFDHGLIDGVGPTNRVRKEISCARRLYSVTKNCALGVSNLTCAGSCCLPLVLRVRTPPLRNLPRGALGQVGSRWLVAPVREQDRWPLYRMPRQLQRLGTRTTGVTPGPVFALGLIPSPRGHQDLLVLVWKSSHHNELAFSQLGNEDR